MNRNDFIDNEKASRDTIDVKRAYIMMSGDITSGVLLSQIIYWHLPNKEGHQRLTVEHNNHMWLAKKRDDWWDEICMLPKQFDRAIKNLETRQLVKTQLLRFHGSPTKHIRLNWDVFLPVYEAMISDGKPSYDSNDPKGGKWIFPDREYPTSLIGNIQIDEQGISETPRKPAPAFAPTLVEEGPETTTENTIKDSSDFDKSDVLEYVQTVVDGFNRLKDKYPDKITQKVNRPRKTETVAKNADKRYRAIIKWHKMKLSLSFVLDNLKAWIEALPDNRTVSGVNYFENYVFNAQNKLKSSGKEAIKHTNEQIEHIQSMLAKKLAP